MPVELECPRCFSHFSPEADAPARGAWERMTEEGPWSALGDGETFEDVLHTALTAQGSPRCPHCGAAVPVSQDDLCALSREILSNW
jgi:hypothetical protein